MAVASDDMFKDAIDSTLDVSQLLEQQGVQHWFGQAQKHPRC